MLDFAQGVARNRDHGDVAFTSVCTAHPDVLIASQRLVQDRDIPLMIKTTFNQVNQFGGYTGMTPDD